MNQFFTKYTIQYTIAALALTCCSHYLLPSASPQDRLKRRNSNPSLNLFLPGQDSDLETPGSEESSLNSSPTSTTSATRMHLDHSLGASTVLVGPFPAQPVPGTNSRANSAPSSPPSRAATPALHLTPPSTPPSLNSVLRSTLASSSSHPASYPRRLSAPTTRLASDDCEYKPQAAIRRPATNQSNTLSLEKTLGIIDKARTNNQASMLIHRENKQQAITRSKEVRKQFLPACAMAIFSSLGLYQIAKNHNAVSTTETCLKASLIVSLVVAFRKIANSFKEMANHFIGKNTEIEELKSKETNHRLACNFFDNIHAKMKEIGSFASEEAIIQTYDTTARDIQSQLETTNTTKEQSRIQAFLRGQMTSIKDQIIEELKAAAKDDQIVNPQ